MWPFRLLTWGYYLILDSFVLCFSLIISPNCSFFTIFFGSLFIFPYSILWQCAVLQLYAIMIVFSVLYVFVSLRHNLTWCWVILVLLLDYLDWQLHLFSLYMFPDLKIRVFWPKIIFLGWIMSFVECIFFKCKKVMCFLGSDLHIHS